MGLLRSRFRMGPKRLAAMNRPPFAMLVGLCAGLWLPCRAHAGEPEPDRHLGVQVRALLGPALLYGFQDVGAGSSGTTRGVGVGLDFALGSMVAQRLALNMDLGFARSADAEHGTLRNTAFSSVFLGGGVTYWLMPANVFLAGSLGLSRSSVQGSPVHLDLAIPTSEQSRIGVGAHLALGKQFWVSRRVGLGAVLSLISGLAANPGGGADSNRYVLAATLGLCATLH
jgi:hypothetical protein